MHSSSAGGQPADPDRPWLSRIAKHFSAEELESLAEVLSPPTDLDTDLYRVFALAKMLGDRHVDIEDPLQVRHSRDTLTELFARALLELNPEDSARLAVEMSEVLPVAHLTDSLRRVLNFFSDGIKVLVVFRGKVLLHARQVPAFRESTRSVVEKIRVELLPHFGRACTEVRRIRPSISDVTLNHMLAVERVHPLHTIDELRARLDLDNNKLCYGVFHPAFRNLPVIFVHVGLTKGVASSMEDLEQNALDISDADTAIFFSISSAFDGLAGVDLGHNLLSDVVAKVKKSYRQIKQFSTLSPMVNFLGYINTLDKDAFEALFSKEEKELLKSERVIELVPSEKRPRSAQHVRDFVLALLNDAPQLDADILAALERPLMRLADTYVHSKSAGGSKNQLDSVANFHLRNGAAIYRINWAADLHPRALRRSASIMVNYIYEPDKLWERGLRYRTFGDVESYVPEQE